MPDPIEFLKKLASGGLTSFAKRAGYSSSEQEKETPTPVFIRRSYVEPKPPQPPKPSETGKKGTLKPISSTGSKGYISKRRDLERNEQTVEKANNDQSVIENSNNSNSDSSTGPNFNPYKDFGGG